MALVGRAARVLHDEARAALGPSIVDRLPDHDLASEVRSTLRAGEHVRALLPEVGRQFDDVAAGVVRALEGVEGHPACFLHGDLKSDNLLVDDGRVRVLDLDRVCLGDAALDLGKLLADLRWCAGSEPRAQRLQAALRDGYGPAADDRWARAGLLTALFALKFAARRCAVHDPEWESRGARAGGPGAVHPLRGSEAVVTASLALDLDAATRLAVLDPALAQLAAACHTTPTPATGCCTTRGGPPARAAGSPIACPPPGTPRPLSTSASPRPAGPSTTTARTTSCLGWQWLPTRLWWRHGSRLPPGNPCSAARWSR